MPFPIPLIAALLGTALGGTGLAYGGARAIENIAGEQSSPTIRATTAPVNIRARGGAQGGSPQPTQSPTYNRATAPATNDRAREGARVANPAPQPAVANIPIYGSRNPDTPYAAVNAMFGEPKPTPTAAPVAAPKATPKPASKPAAKQGAKAPAQKAPQGSDTATPMAPPAQEDPFTQAQRMVNGTEQIPASAVAPVSDPVEDRYQLLLKMYGIGQPAADPYTEAQRMLNGTEASLGKIKDPNAALQYYGGDQAVYDALARMYGW